MMHLRCEADSFVRFVRTQFQTSKIYYFQRIIDGWKRFSKLVTSKRARLYTSWAGVIKHLANLESIPKAVVVLLRMGIKVEPKIKHTVKEL